MKPFIYIASISALLLLCSCERILDVKGSEAERKIVFNSIIENDENFTCYMSRTSIIGDEEPWSSSNRNSHQLTNYNLQILVNGKEVDHLKNSSQEKLTVAYEPKAGDLIQVRASAPSLPNIEAEGTIPAPLVASSPIRIDEKEGKQEEKEDWNSEIGNYTYTEYNKDITIHIPFRDIPNADNFYRVELKVIFRQKLSSGETWQDLKDIDIEDPIIEKGGANNIFFGSRSTKALFRDTQFKDQEHTFKASFTVPYKRSKGNTSGQHTKEYMTVIVTRYHLSPALYFYWKTKEASDMASYNPFSEPVQIFSNVKNGFGILGTMFVSQEEVEHKLSVN